MRVEANINEFCRTSGERERRELRGGSCLDLVIKCYTTPPGFIKWLALLLHHITKAKTGNKGITKMANSTAQNSKPNADRNVKSLPVAIHLSCRFAMLM